MSTHEKLWFVNPDGPVKVWLHVAANVLAQEMKWSSKVNRLLAKDNRIRLVQITYKAKFQHSAS
jgi:hypothetical protein